MVSRAMQAEDESVILMDSPEQPRTSKNARRRARKAAERAAKLVEDTAQAECRKELPSIQGSSPTLVPRAVELKIQEETGMDSERALECLAESPPDLFVYAPLKAEDMDILDASDFLDVSDEELAPLQAFVDEGKDDRSGDGDMESDVEQVSETPSAFLRYLPS